jgi:hypothetical protein
LLFVFILLPGGLWKHYPTFSDWLAVSYDYNFELMRIVDNLQSMKLLRSWNLLCSVVLLQIANNFVSAAEGNTPDH